MATVRMPSSWALRKTRMAISERFAASNLRIGVTCSGIGSVPRSVELGLSYWSLRAKLPKIEGARLALSAPPPEPTRHAGFAHPPPLRASGDPPAQRDRG